MNTSVFLSFCDPEFAFSDRDLRIRIALHALLFDKPTIQDNFMLSEYLWRLNRDDRHITKLVSYDVLQVALRSNANESLVEVNQNRIARTKAGLYRPFLGDSLALYESSAFQQYARELDRASQTLSGVVTWDPIAHGSMYRAKMLESAIVSPGEWDLDVEEAVGIFEVVERSVADRVHSRSAYFDVADRYYSDNPAKNEAIKRWARALYLTNIPDESHLAMSLPTEALTSSTSKRAREIAWLATEAAEGDSDLLFFLNPAFLATVPAEAIRDFRTHAAFKLLQESLVLGDSERARLYFAQYARDVAKVVPKLLPLSRAKISRYQKHIGAKKLIAISAPGVWLISAALLLSGVGVPVTIGTAAIGTLAKLLGETKGTETLIQKAIDEARASLVESRFRGSILSLVDVVDRIHQA